MTMDISAIDEIRFEIEKGNFAEAAEKLADYEMRGGSQDELLDSGIDDWRLHKFMRYMMDDGEPEYY